MTDIELLPLPEADGFMETFDTYGCPVGSEDAWCEETVKETIRANVAHATAAKDAEVKTLRAERAVIAAKDAEIERLRSALHTLAAHVRPTCSVLWDEAQAALRGHDQEVGNG